MSTRLAFAGNAESVTGIFPMEVEGMAAETAAGTFSVGVIIWYPGDQSLTVPSSKTH